MIELVTLLISNDIELVYSFDRSYILMYGKLCTCNLHLPLHNIVHIICSVIKSNETPPPTDILYQPWLLSAVIATVESRKLAAVANASDELLA